MTLTLTTTFYNISLFSNMAESKQSDEALMLAFQSGNHRAFEILIRRHQNGVYNFIYRFLGNPQTTEEVFQEVFIKIHRAAEKYLPNGKFTTWLYTIVRNQCVDTFRRQKLRETLSLDARNEVTDASLGDMIAGDETPPDELASANEIEDILNYALDQLNPEQKEVFLMREKRGFKFEEIANITGASVNTVKSRMRYALEGLRKILKQSKYRELLEERD